ncbi:hypothetical protein ACE6H2_005524 [Prunus campanulata]
MGTILSLNHSRTRGNEPYEVLQSAPCKRPRLSSSFYEKNPRLIPCLPDEISIQILSRIPRIHYLKLKSVSRTWKATILSAELFSLRKEMGTTEEWLYILTKVANDKLIWYALDPLARRWQRLPPMPNVSREDESRKGLAALRMWNMAGSSIRITDVIMEDVPIRDFTESESPYLLAGFLGKLHVITKDANQNIAVLQVYVQNHVASISAASSSSLVDPIEHAERPTESELDLWKVIATRSAPATELVSCLVLDI